MTSRIYIIYGLGGLQIDFNTPRITLLLIISACGYLKWNNEAPKFI